MTSGDGDVVEFEQQAGDDVPVEADDVPPFTMCPHWVLFSDLTPQAKTLWWALAAHVNRKREGKVVWPSRQTLAAILGMKRPQSVDGYLTELVEAGALRVEQRRMGRMKVRNHYFVRFNQPRRSDAAASVDEFYQRRQAAALGISGARVLFET